MRREFTAEGPSRFSRALSQGRPLVWALAAIAVGASAEVAQAGCTSCVRWYSATSAGTGSTAAQTLSISMTVPTATECPAAMLLAVVSIVNPSGTVPTLETTTGATWDPDPPGSATNLTYQNSSSVTSSPTEGNHLRSEMWTLQLPDTGSGTLTLDLAGSASARMYGGGIVFCGVRGISQGVTAAISDPDDVVTQSTTDASGRMFVDNCTLYGTRTATKTQSAQTLNWTNGYTGHTSSDVLSMSSRVAQTGTGLSYGYTFDDLDYYACSAISFRPWGTTAVGLEDFSAKSTDKGVFLSWRAGQEANNLGYRLFREDSDGRVLVTPELIAGSALSYPGSPLESGYSYAWWDPEGQPTSRYFLEDRELGGRETLHGPFATEPGTSVPSLGSQRPSRPISKVGERNALMDGRSDGAAEMRPVLDRPMVQISDANLQKQRALAAREAAKVVVNQEGWYRLTGSAIAAAVPGILGSPSESLQLFVNGAEQAIVVNDGGDHSFDAADSVEFYGVPLDTQWSGTQTYWLVRGTERGERVAARGAVAKNGTTITTMYSAEQKDRLFYAGGVLNGEEENFFGKVITTTPAVMNLSVFGIDRAASQTAKLEVAVQGFSDVSHEVKVSLNGVPTGSIAFTGKAMRTVAFPLRSDALVEGSNVVAFQEVGEPTAASAVGSVRVTYPRFSKARNDQLTFSLASADVNSAIQVSGFSSSRIRVFDVTDPGRVILVRGTVGVTAAGGAPSGDAGFSVNIAKQPLKSPGEDGVRHLLALSDAAILQPVSVTANTPSTWSGPENGADYVVIAHRSLLPAVADLKSLRESQGLKVLLVDAEDVYDEFDFGVKSPRAIREFLRTATTSWTVRPRYAVLVGDGSQDPRDYLGLGQELVPTKLVDTKTVETASDDWMADFDGDGVADLALGRLPAENAADAAAIVAKIVRNEVEARGIKKSLFVADTAVLSNFAVQNQELRALLPSTITSSAADADVMGDAATRTAILDAVASGVDLIHYSGHGTIDHWRGTLLSVTDVPLLGNAERLPIFTVTNCLTGIFQEPLLRGLGEVLLKAPAGGAVAVWASSGTTEVLGQEDLMRDFMKSLADSAGPKTLGDAARRAKGSVTDPDVRSTWILLGDPAMRIH